MAATMRSCREMRERRAFAGVDAGFIWGNLRCSRAVYAKGALADGLACVLVDDMNGCAGWSRIG